MDPIQSAALLAGCCTVAGCGCAAVDPEILTTTCHPTTASHQRHVYRAPLHRAAGSHRVGFFDRIRRPSSVGASLLFQLLSRLLGCADVSQLDNPVSSPEYRATEDPRLTTDNSSTLNALHVTLLTARTTSSSEKLSYGVSSQTTSCGPAASTSHTQPERCSPKVDRQPNKFCVPSVSHPLNPLRFSDTKPNGVHLHCDTSTRSTTDSGLSDDAGRVTCGDHFHRQGSSAFDALSASEFGDPDKSAHEKTEPNDCRSTTTPLSSSRAGPQPPASAGGSYPASSCSPHSASPQTPSRHQNVTRCQTSAVCHAATSVAVRRLSGAVLGHLPEDFPWTAAATEFSPNAVERERRYQKWKADIANQGQWRHAASFFDDLSSRLHQRQYTSPACLSNYVSKSPVISPISPSDGMLSSADPFTAAPEPPSAFFIRRAYAQSLTEEQRRRATSTTASAVARPRVEL